MNRVLVIVLIFSAASLLLLGLIVYPLLSQIKKNSADFILAKKTLATFQSEIENLEQFKEIYKTLEPSLALTEGLFVDPSFPVDFIKFLEKIGAGSKVSVDVLPTTIPKNANDPWPSMGFQLSLSGALPDCLKFFEKIETVPYLIEVQKFSAALLAKKGAGESAEENISVNMMLKVFTR